MKTKINPINTTRVNLPEIIGAGYKDFWNTRKRYAILKGGKGSKKSTTASLRLIHNIMKYPLSNAIAVRRVKDTIKNSVFTQLKWAARKLNVYDSWKFTTSPLEAVYKPTGQKIIFAGFDDALKLASITVDIGVICWVWLEEAFEIENEEDFNKLDFSIRGIMPEGLFPQLVLTFNPWVVSHWTKKRFFDRDDPDAFTMTATYKLNEFLTDADRKLMEKLEVENPSLYKVIGLGEYGIPGGTYFDEFRTDIHIIDPFTLSEQWRRYRVLDYGLDMLACYWIAVDTYSRAYVYKELYESNLIISKAAEKIISMTNETIYQTIAPPDLRNRQKDTGDSIADTFAKNGVKLTFASNDRIQGWTVMKEWLKPFKDELGDMIARLRIFKNCTNLIRTLPQIQCDPKEPNDVSDKPHELTHAPDAIRYFCSWRVKPNQPVQEKEPPKNKYKSLINYGR